MPDATPRPGGTATAPPRAATATTTGLAFTPGPPTSPLSLSSPTSPASPASPAAVPSVRRAGVLLSQWARLALLVVLLAAGAAAVLVFEPQKLLTEGRPLGFGGGAAVPLFVVAYGLCTVAFVPRPLLNLAAGALFGTAAGLGAALGGTVLGAGIAFCLGRLLGQEALRPLLRGRVLRAADGQLSRHGFRSMMAARLFPGVPFWAANYGAAVSRMGLTPFLLATALGSVPNTAAYAVAGARASTPTSPAFLIALACIAVPGLVGATVAWRKRHHLRAR